MSNDLSYTMEEVAQLLKVSKLTVYDLVKKGEIPVFRVGRQMRMDAGDLAKYIEGHKNKTLSESDIKAQPFATKDSPDIVISGQDMILDILGKNIEKHSPSYKILRSYTGSLNSLISMYNGKLSIASLHLYDGDTGEYNLAYVKKVLVGHPYILIRLVSRKAGFYVQEGNPSEIHTWADLKRKNVKLVNREIGSGARTFLDEQLRIHHLSSKSIKGYEHIETSHYSVASAVSTGAADVGVGIEKAAKIVGVHFLPLITEKYDLVMLKTPQNEKLINIVKDILLSPSFRSEIISIGDYDISEMGSIIYETL